MLAIGRRTPKALLFPRPDGKPWRENDYRNWRRRVFDPLWRLPARTSKP